ncbi:MAG: HPr kinase/phosphatase C-terminal domain-containing protein [Proteobacteria bacterium]|nr:HPr kinase/phosphatase C-terminal domain-containing protein [Pseudomonadota bacterium]
MSLRANVTCVAIGGRGLLIEGPPGSGKSSLALALIDRGAVLVGDDGVDLAPRGDRVLASPAPAIAGLIEVRGVGLIPVPTMRDVPLALVLRLDGDAPRHIDAAETALIEAAPLPLVRLWPGSPVLHLRAEAALARWGLA